MGSLEESLRILARESGRTLGELGVRPGDTRWIRQHAETIAGLGGKRRRFRLRQLWRGLPRSGGSGREPGADA